MLNIIILNFCFHSKWNNRDLEQVLIEKNEWKQQFSNIGHQAVEATDPWERINKWVEQVEPAAQKEFPGSNAGRENPNEA